MIQSFKVSTNARSELQDITGKVQQVVNESGVKNGICHVFVSHTTAGVTINENADPAVKQDIISILDKNIPWRDNYKHMEGNSAAHLKASLMGFSTMVPIQNGSLVLGTWQCIYFCEFDGPRTRTCIVNVLKGD